MKIVDLADEHRELFSLCLEDWSAEAKEAGTRRSRWIERSLAKGLRAHLAFGEGGAAGGMIQHLPIEHSVVDGAGLHFIPCVWVHGHAQGRGNFQGEGMGSALLEAAESDARAHGAKGMAAWGLWLPFWMRAAWFKKHGYRKADRQGLSMLMWKPFVPDAAPPRWFPEGKRLPEPVAGKVNVTVFSNGWCMAMNLAAERARRAALELGDRVAYREIDTSERSAVAKWGHSDAVFIDGRPMRNGPPPSFEKLRELIARRLRALR